MGIFVDIILVVLIALSIFLGYKKGLAQLAIKLCAFIIAILITFILYRPIANLVINTTSIDESIEDTIYNKVTEMIQKDETNELTSDLIESAKQGMLEQSARELAINVVYGGTIIILFIIVRIALIFVSALANLVAKLPIIKQAGIGVAMGNANEAIKPHADYVTTSVDDDGIARALAHLGVI